jgi:hypothetical protein
MNEPTVDFTAFCAHLNDAAPPAGIKPEVVALWWERRGDWDAAHKIVQDIESTDAAHIHAYLHRVEGDLENAAYWYKRANQSVCDLTLHDEWDILVRRLLRSS